jgi:hypothetical protein
MSQAQVAHLSSRCARVTVAPSAASNLALSPARFSSASASAIAPTTPSPLRMWSSRAARADATLPAAPLPPDTPCDPLPPVAPAASAVDAADLDEALPLPPLALAPRPWLNSVTAVRLRASPPGGTGGRVRVLLMRRAGGPKSEERCDALRLRFPSPSGGLGPAAAPSSPPAPAASTPSSSLPEADAQQAASSPLTNASVSPPLSDQPSPAPSGSVASSSSLGAGQRSA